jgi:hypothetical protein
VLADVRTLSKILLLRGKTYVCEDAVNDDQGGTNGNTDGDHEVGLSGLVKIAGHGPSGRVGVVRLHGCTAPGSVAVGVGQDVGVASDDGNHDDVADEATEDGTPALGQEHDTRGDFEVLAHLQVVRQVDGVADDVVGPSSEVHVSNRALGHHQTRKHLGQVVGGDTVTVSRVDDCALLLRSVPENHARNDEKLTNGAMIQPKMSATTYAQADRVMLFFKTTMRPRAKLTTRTATYHHHGASL